MFRIMSFVTRFVNKAFGSLSYEAGMSEYKHDYIIYALEESITISER